MKKMTHVPSITDDSITGKIKRELKAQVDLTNIATSVKLASTGGLVAGSCFLAATNSTFAPVAYTLAGISSAVTIIGTIKVGFDMAIARMDYKGMFNQDAESSKYIKNLQANVERLAVFLTLTSGAGFMLTSGIAESIGNQIPTTLASAAFLLTIPQIYNLVEGYSRTTNSIIQNDGNNAKVLKKTNNL